MTKNLTEKKEYFSELYEKNFDYVYSYVFTRVAGNLAITEEIIQDTFISAWQSLEKFKGNSTFGTWVCSIAKNKLKQYYRKQAYKQKHEDQQADALTINGATDALEKKIIEKENSETVFATLAKIPEFYSLALIMKYIEGYSVKEIAKITGRTPKAIDGVLQRARAAFEKVYLSNGSEL